MPLDAFKAQMERYNKIVETKVDDEFGKTIPAEAKPVE